MGCHEEVTGKRVGSGAKTGTSRANHDLSFLKSGHVISVGCLNLAEIEGLEAQLAFQGPNLARVCSSARHHVLLEILSVTLSQNHSP